MKGNLQPFTHKQNRMARVQGQLHCNNMHVTLYKSALCPRCHLARKYLREIISENPEIILQEIDVVKAPRRSWNDGIRMIPALKIDNHVLGALYLSKSAIAEFIAGHRNQL